MKVIWHNANGDNIKVTTIKRAVDQAKQIVVIFIFKTNQILAVSSIVNMANLAIKNLHI